MIIKKYTAGTETDAILMAKEELGKDAVVMNVKKYQPRGLAKIFKKPRVEITAALDENPPVPKKPVHTERYNEEKPIASNPNILIEEEKPVKKEFAMEKKLNQLQAILQEPTPTVNPTNEPEEKPKDERTSRVEACRQLIYEQLIQNEVAPEYATALMGEIEKSINADSSIDYILGNVYQKIILKLGQPHIIGLSKEESEPAVKYYFFIGPTGVGKTTTIAKIASELSLNQKKRVALITSDTYRIAAVEQLKTYATILNIPLKVVYAATEMEAVMEELADYDIVLVDTAGRSHRNKEHVRDLGELLETVPKENRQVYLVLSATTKYQDLCSMAMAYQKLTSYSLIFTKLDETALIGNLYNIHMLTNEPISYTTCGQNVPDDLSVIDPQKIAKQLLGGDV